MASGSPDVIVPLTVDDPPEIGVGSELGGTELGGTELGGTELGGADVGGTEPPVESPGLVETSPLLGGADEGAEVGIVTGGEVGTPDVGTTLLVSIVGRTGEIILVTTEATEDNTLPGSEVGDTVGCEVMVSVGGVVTGAVGLADALDTSVGAWEGIFDVGATVGSVMELTTVGT